MNEGRFVYTSLSKDEFLEKEKNKVIARILTQIELQTNYVELTNTAKENIRKTILDNVNDLFRLMQAECN